MRRFRLPRNRFLRLVILPVCGLGACAVIAAAIIYETHKPHNVSHPNLSFTAPTTTTTTTPAKVKPKVNSFSWPLYGYTAARTRDYSDAPSTLKPPFRVAWTHGGNALLEFSPSIYGNYLFYMDDGATVKAVDTRDGRQVWMTHLGTRSAATPALDPKDKLLFVPVLSLHGNYVGAAGGEFAALSMTTGRVRWKISIPPGSESSPLYRAGSVYFGSQSGEVYALDALTGHVKWTFNASGAVKAGPAYANGLLYFGDYAGKVYCVSAATGKLVWEAGSGSGAFGYGTGTFYATPAVAFGRVYVGNTNGFIYSFAARTGQLAWSRGTGAYVYSAPAVADIAGIGPTVYIGSYNGNFYALNAQSGAIEWAHDDGARISGASTIVGNVVYYSDFDRHTTGLDVRTGKVVFSFNDSAYTPVIADPTAIFLDGNYVLYKLVPR